MSDLVRFRRFKGSDGYATGVMVLHEEGGWVRYQDAAKRIRELEEEVARLRAAIREHRDSFNKDMEEHDWTTEDETLWSLVEETQGGTLDE